VSRGETRRRKVPSDGTVNVRARVRHPAIRENPRLGFLRSAPTPRNSGCVGLTIRPFSDEEPGELACRAYGSSPLAPADGWRETRPIP
jgi:hypothetical protein